MITITIGNSKGGVGKTSTVQNLVAGLSLIGKKVLVIDADPQANLSNVLGVPESQAQRLDIFEYDKKNTVALNYITFLKELLNIVEVK